MRRIAYLSFDILRWFRYLVVATIFFIQAPDEMKCQAAQSLEEVNDALAEETENVIETGRLIANIVVVIGFVMLMLNIAFKVMDNSKATVIFLFILLLRGLYEVIF